MHHPDTGGLTAKGRQHHKQTCLQLDYQELQRLRRGTTPIPFSPWSYDEEITCAVSIKGVPGPRMGDGPSQMRLVRWAYPSELEGVSLWGRVLKTDLYRAYTKEAT